MSDDTFEAAERAEYHYLVEEEEEEEQYATHRRYVHPPQVVSRRCILLIGLTAAALLCLAVYLGYESKTLPPGSTRVFTQCGDFRGRYVSPNTPTHIKASANTSKHRLTHIKASAHWLHWDLW